MSQFQSRTAAAPFNPDAALDLVNDTGPQVAADGAGNWVALWVQATDDSPSGGEHEILVSRSTDYGSTWTTPVLLDPIAAKDGASDYISEVVTDGTGHWVAVWAREIDINDLSLRYGIFVSRSTDNGSTWAAPVELNTDPLGGNVIPQIATDGTGHWVAVWAASIEDPGLVVVRSTDNGATWTAPAALDNADFSSDNFIDVATDGTGHWIAVWESTSTFGSDQDILVARSTDNGVSWTDPATLNTNAATDSGSDRFPQIASDGAGHWVAVWDSRDTLGGTIGGDGDILVARSIDNGVSWTAPAALNTFAAADVTLEQFAKVTTDGAGNWVASWTSLNTLNTPLRFTKWISRSSDNGATWTTQIPPDIDFTPAQPGGSPPHVATDGAGTWICLWEILDPFDNDPFDESTDYDILYTRWTGILAPDRDADNLSDSDETIAGTDPNNWNTDADFLSDADEINIYATDPLDFDSDDDGVMDGIEISLGTDPNDPLDFPILPLSWKWLATLALTGIILALGITYFRNRAANRACPPTL